VLCVLFAEAGCPLRFDLADDACSFGGGRGAAGGQAYHLRAPVTMVGEPLNVPEALEIVDCGDERRLAQPGPPGEIGQPRAFGLGVLKDAAVCGPDVGKSGASELLVQACHERSVGLPEELREVEIGS
jgi:hypothetical protein